MFCGSRGPKSRLAKAAGAEPTWEMRGQTLHTTMVRSTFRSQNAKSTTCSEHFWKFSSDVEKVHSIVVRSTCPSQNGKGPHVRTTFGRRIVEAGAMDAAPCQKSSKHEGFVEVAKTMAGVGRLKRICKDGCHVAGAVQETSSAKIFGK